MYKKIAKFYDRLGWSDFPLKLWDSLKTYFQEESFNPSSYLDIACGTGVMAIKAASEGINAEGLDISIDMLNMAKENAKGKNLDIPFYHEDIRNFKLNKKYDLITCTFDAINHLLTQKEWKQTFSNVKEHLNDNGIFIFDTNTLKALQERWSNIHVNKDSEGNYMIQKGIHDEEKGMSTATFTVFTKEENGLYDGFEETFTEIAFPSNQVIDFLREAGFQNITITDINFNIIEDPDQAYRNVYICK